MNTHHYLIAILTLTLLGALPTRAASATTIETHCDTPQERANLARYTDFAAAVLNGASPQPAADFYAPTFTWHDAPEGMPTGAAAMQRLHAAWRAAGWTLAWPADLAPGTPLPPAPPLRSMLPNAPDATPAPSGNLGHPTLVRCDGDAPLLASYYELFNNLWLSRRVDEIGRWVDPQFSTPFTPPGAPRGPQLLAGFVNGVAAAFPKRHLFNDVVLCGDGLVAARQTVLAINDGSFMGKPPTHRVTLVTWTDTYRFRDGKVLETFAADGDTIDTARQLGWVLLPPGETRSPLAPLDWIDRYPAAD